jgi:hypothetical protein
MDMKDEKNSMNCLTLSLATVPGNVGRPPKYSEPLPRKRDAHMEMPRNLYGCKPHRLRLRCSGASGIRHLVSGMKIDILVSPT